MSECLDRAAEVLRETVAPLAHANRLWAGLSGPNREAYRDGVRSILRAYQDLREWGEADIQWLPVGALFVDERGHVYRLGAYGLLFPPGSNVGSPIYTLGPQRLVYSPDDLKED